MSSKKFLSNTIHFFLKSDKRRNVYILLSSLLICHALPTKGQDLAWSELSSNYTTITSEHGWTINENENLLPLNPTYEKRLDRIQRKWLGLIPKAQKVQFAGGIGLVSVGVTWDYGRREQWETDFMIGFVPKYATHNNKFSFTLRQNYIPWTLPIGDKFDVAPATLSLAVNTIGGDEFWADEPDRYPKGYYGFSSKIRFHLGVGQRLTYHINYNKRKLSKDITFFYELSTCDLYVVSYFTNKYIKLKDIFSLSLGLKFQIF